MAAKPDETAVEPRGWVGVLNQNSSRRELLDPPLRALRKVSAMAGGEELSAKGIRDEPILKSLARLH